MADRCDDDGTLWQTVEMVCVVCSHQWVPVFPIEVPALECPGCGYMNSVPGGPTP